MLVNRSSRFRSFGRREDTAHHCPGHPAKLSIHMKYISNSFRFLHAVADGSAGDYSDHAMKPHYTCNNGCCLYQQLLQAIKTMTDSRGWSVGTATTGSGVNPKNG